MFSLLVLIVNTAIVLSIGSIETRCPDIPKLQFLPGSGWDALVNKPMNETTIFTYNQCKVTNDGKYLIPDGTEAVLKKTTEFEVKGELIEHWLNFTEPTASGFNVISDILPLKYQSLYSSFSENFHKVKKSLVLNYTMIGRSQFRHVMYEIHVTPDAPLDDLLKNKFMEAIDAINNDQINIAEYVLETIVRDYGTHYTKTIDIGALFIKTDFLPLSFLDSKYEKGRIVSAIKASLGSIGFTWRDKHYLDTSILSTYESRISSKEIQVIGGPKWENGLTAEEWAARTTENLTVIDRSGNLLTGLINVLKFNSVSKTVLTKLEDMLAKAITNYYRRNIYEGCTQMYAQNFDYSANVDNGSCGLDEYLFGGFYSTCHGPHSKSICSLYNKNNNIYGGGPYCAANFTSTLLLKETEIYVDNKTCPHNRYEICPITYYATVLTYVCTALTNTSTNVNKVLYGGFLTAVVDDSPIKVRSCPPSYSTLKFSNYGLHICYSTSTAEPVKRYALSFGGFTSCKMNGCRAGYKPHLVYVHKGDEIYYCSKGLTLTNNSFEIPKLVRPPFVNLSSNETDECEFVAKSTVEGWYVVGFYIVLCIALILLLLCCIMRYKMKKRVEIVKLIHGTPHHQKSLTYVVKSDSAKIEEIL